MLRVLGFLLLVALRCGYVEAFTWSAHSRKVRPPKVAAFVAQPLLEANTDDSDPFLRKPLATVPRHVAIIPDGNGRWATDQGLPRAYGHVVGAGRIKEVRMHLLLSLEHLIRKRGERK